MSVKQEHIQLMMPNNEAASVALRYSLVGKNVENLVVVLGGISANCEVADRVDGSQGWWTWTVGQGKPIDTEKFRVLSFDYLDAFPGSNSNFISTEQQADVLEALLDHLGVAKISTFVGASYGGMVGLAFAARHSKRIEKLLVISAAHRNSPFSVAFRTIQRKIVQLETKTNEQEKISLARSLAMLSYSTPGEIDNRFTDKTEFLDSDNSNIWSYLKYQGDKYAAKTESKRFLSLSRSIDHHHIDPSRIVTPMTVITCNQDFLVPVDICRELVNQAGGPANLVNFDSQYGHDSFLRKEVTEIPKILLAI